jgi:hypothetical protein
MSSPSDDNGSRTKAMRRYFAAGFAVLVAFALGYAADALPRRMSPAAQYTIVSLSPDGAHRMKLAELGGSQHGFELVLEEMRGGPKRVIYQLPDEKRLIGSERIIWSKDANAFLLVGRHFNVDAAAKLPDGTQLYLLYSCSSGDLKCNQGQQTQYPAFTLADIEKIDWAADNPVAAKSETMAKQ